ncbi:MAG: O-antigen ligase family protein [Candidatus Nanopelagicales bacterium]|nr:O-antigen ligase family protein [Candidatus Nanopelagicales bacterium]
MSNLRELFRREPFYLWLAMCLPAVSVYLHSLAPGRAVFKGQDLGVLVGILGGLLIYFFWLTYRSPRSPSKLQIFLLLIGLAWGYSILRTQIDGSVFNETFFLLPEIALLLAFKSVNRRGIEIAGLCLAYSLILIVFLNLLLSPLGIGPDGFHIADSGSTRVPLLTEFLGIDTRWGGPFGSVNTAGPIGGFVFVFAFTQKRLGNKLALGIGGGIILVLSQARTSLIAVIIALTVYFLWSEQIQKATHRIAIRITTFFFLLVGSVVYLVGIDPTLNGRMQIWHDFFALWRDSPLIGVGTSGVNVFVESRTGIAGLVTHNHAHSVFIDGLMRYGIIMLVLTLIIFIMVFSFGIRTIPTIGPTSIAISIYIFTAGLTETIFSWSYWGVPVAALLLAALMGLEGPRTKTNIEVSQSRPFQT